MGFFYINGTYVDKNLSKGLNYLYLAAEQCNNEAQFILGTFYLKKDVRQAIKYYKEASSYNNEHAKNNLSIIFKKRNWYRN